MRILTVMCVAVVGVLLLSTPASSQSRTKGEMGQVEAAQQALRDKGHDPGAVDGRIGARTRAALRDFQKKEGLDVTGRLDGKTMAKLGIEGKTRVPSSSGAVPPTAATAPPEAGKRGPGASSTTPQSEMGRDAATTKKDTKQR